MTDRVTSTIARTLASSMLLCGCTVLRSWDDLSGGEQTVDDAGLDAGLDADADAEGPADADPDAPDGEPQSPMGGAIEWKSSCGLAGLTPALEFGGGEPFTVELWFEPESLGGSDVLVYHGGSNLDNHGWDIEIASTNLVHFYARNPDADAGADCSNDAVNLQVGHQYHLAIVRVGSGADVLLLDRTAGDTEHRFGSVSCAEVPPSWSIVAPLSIGGSSDSGGCTDTTGVEGKMDDVRVWTGARTKAEIDASYAAQLDCAAQSTLVANWKLDETDGQAASDSCARPGIELALEGTSPANYAWVPSPFDDPR